MSLQSPIWVQSESEASELAGELAGEEFLSPGSEGSLLAKERIFTSFKTRERDHGGVS